MRRRGSSGPARPLRPRRTAAAWASGSGEGYAAKFRRHADQAGNAPRGFRRGAERPHLLEVDPAAIGEVVALFERYAVGNVSLVALENETGIPADGIRALLGNPIFNGWVRRHRRTHEEELEPAPWRSHPPVPDELWSRVQEVRHNSWTGGGGRAVHVHLLAKLLWCSCGARIKADVTQPAAAVHVPSLSAHAALRIVD